MLDICNEHVYAVKSFVKNPELQSAVSKEIEGDCQELIDYVLAAKRFNLEVNARSKDRVVSFGEKLSCRFMTAMLKDRVGLSANTPDIHIQRGRQTNSSRSTSRLNTLTSPMSCTTTARSA